MQATINYGVMQVQSQARHDNEDETTLAMVRGKARLI